MEKRREGWDDCSQRGNKLLKRSVLVLTSEVGKIVEKFNEKNVLLYLERGLVVSGHQC